MPDIAEVGVSQGFLHRNTPGRVQVEHLQTEVQTLFVEVLEVGLGVDSFEFGESSLEVWQIVWVKVEVRMLVH